MSHYSDSDTESSEDSIMEFLEETHDSKAEPEKIKEDLVLGIDLGTTNSCISVWRGGKCEIIPDEYGNKTVPSYVAYSNVNKYVGLDAKRQKDINVENVFYEVKRLMGRDFYDKSVADAVEMLSYSIVKTDIGVGIQSTVQGDRIFSPEEISSMILVKLKKIAEVYLKRPVEDVVITVPAQFNDTQRQATRNAATIAGLNCLRVFHEPTAAALAYGMMERSLHKTAKVDNASQSDASEDSDNAITIMVYDFGGGTLDVSIMDVDDGCFNVMGSAGISYFGGLDFDNRIMSFAIAKFSMQYYKHKNALDGKISRLSMQKLRNQSEQAKKILSSTLSAVIAVPDFHEGHDLFVKIKRSEFDMYCRDLYIICMEPVDAILKECGLQDIEIDEVIMVGGMTRVPHIREMLSNRFRNSDGDTRVNCSINPDEAISVGAAIQGHMIATQSDAFGQNLSLMDVTPLTLGVEVMGGIMDIVVDRNTVIPCEVSKLYSTDTDDVTSVSIKVYEGERTLTMHNTLIGEFELYNIPKYPRGIPEIEITFKIDSNGIVTVSACEDENKEKNEITVNSNKGGLSQDQIAELVAESEEQEMADEIHRVKKGSHYELCDLCANVITNINNSEFKLTKRDISTITEDIENVRAWLDEKNYYDREIKDYEDALHNMKKKYGVLILHGKIDRNKNIKAAGTELNATTVYGNEEDEIEEEMMQAFEKVQDEDAGVDDGMTDIDKSELKELRTSLYDLCESVMGIIHSGQMQISDENKVGVDNIVSDIMIWWSSCTKPTKTDYVSKIDEINKLCDDIVDEYERDGKKMFKVDDMYSETEKYSEKLEKLCSIVLTMAKARQLQGDRARITLLATKATRNIDMILKYDLHNQGVDVHGKSEDGDSDDDFLNLSEEEFQDMCSELLDEFNDACNSVHNTASGIHIQKRSIVPQVKATVDYTEYAEDDVVKNKIDTNKEEGGGTRIIDIMRRRMNEEIDRNIHEQIQDENRSNTIGMDGVSDDAIIEGDNTGTDDANADNNTENVDKHQLFIN